MSDCKCALALGFFDGVHQAHRAVLARAREAANLLSVPAIAVTFDRHPAAALSGESPEQIQQLSDRVSILKSEAYMDDVIVLTFDKAFRDQPWETFAEYLVHDLNAVFVSVGYDFRFGKGAQGNAERLAEVLTGHGVSCGIVERMDSPDGMPWAARRLRQQIKNGEVEQVATLLGRPFTFSGEVLHGKNLGHTLGFPTMNVSVPQELVRPAAGVYASKVVLDGQEYLSVTNISETGLSETFVFDFSGDVYGKILRVSLLSFRRAMRRFPTWKELAAQVERDKLDAMEWLKTFKTTR